VVEAVGEDANYSYIQFQYSIHRPISHNTLTAEAFFPLNNQFGDSLTGQEMEVWAALNRLIVRSSSVGPGAGDRVD
jgi:hypothetical protein